eukprot:TRINITY_DN5068_c0_g1_i3.p1 TRINITY_DN5068_c0_g1~~TRINITY_DN5068_c0_g1_i3.p1  ORF type:complete len:255 (-),score=29.12 TRINITY_DN5068_c0_g1_i3:24-788(-)
MIGVYIANRIKAGDVQHIEIGINPRVNTYLVAPIFSLAFTCHTNILPAYNDIKSGSISRFMRPVIASLSLVGIIYLATGIIAYLSFGDKIQEELIDNYPDNSTYNIMRTAVFIAIFFIYPISIYPLRKSTNMILLMLQCKKKKYGLEKNKNITLCKNLIITPIIIAATLGFSVIMRDNLMHIFILAGSTSSVALCYIFPALLNLKLRKISNEEDYFTFRNIPKIVLIVFGVLFSLSSIVLFVLEMAEVIIVQRL